MPLRDRLTGPERDELKNMMLNEPVQPGDTISHQTAKKLWQEGLIRREKAGWMVNWEAIQQRAATSES